MKLNQIIKKSLTFIILTIISVSIVFLYINIKNTNEKKLLNNELEELFVLNKGYNQTIGYIPYIDNYRNNWKNLDYNKPIININNNKLSIIDFENNYVIGVFNKTNNILIDKIKFTFKKNSKFVKFRSLNKKIKIEFINKIVPINKKFVNNINYKLLYNIKIKKSNLKYIYSNNNILLKNLNLTSDYNTNHYVLKQGYQFLYNRNENYYFKLIKTIK